MTDKTNLFPDILITRQRLISVFDNTNWDKYIGIPYKKDQMTFEGADCIGLCGLVYSNVLNIPSDDMFALFYYKFGAMERWEDPISGDILYYELGGVRLHIGLYIGKGLMLHTRENGGSHMVRSKAQPWNNPRTVYRHIDLMD
jgi:cell wall-associated NlpC family hydrolase